MILTLILLVEEEEIEARKMVVLSNWQTQKTWFAKRNLSLDMQSFVICKFRAVF